MGENMKRIAIVWLLVFTVFLESFQVLAQEVSDTPVQTEAPSAILMEISTGEVLYDKNSQEQRSPASITKIMTLLLIFEELESGNLKKDLK